MGRRSAGVLVASATILVAGTVGTPGATASRPRPLTTFDPGSPDLGDPLVPGLGNGAARCLATTSTRDYLHANGTSADFMALAARVSGQDLTGFLYVWLCSHHRPAPIRRNAFPNGATVILRQDRVDVPSSFAAIERTDAALSPTQPSAGRRSPGR